MSKTIFSHITVFLSFIIILSCETASDENGDLLALEIKDGVVDIYNSGTGEIIIKDVTSAFTLGEDQLIFINKNDLKISYSPFSDEMGTGTETVMEAMDPESRVRMTWKLRTFKDKPALCAKLEVKNTTGKLIRIDRLHPLVANQGSSGIIINTQEDLHYLKMEPQTWGPPKTIEKLENTALGKMITGLASADGRGAVIGCISFDRFRGFFELNDKRESESVIGINLYNHIDDHLMVDPDESISSEWIYVDCVNDVLDGLEKWAGLAGRMGKAVMSEPPATGFYSWYYYRDHVSEEIMMENARFLDENKDKYPVNFVHLDWGWQREYSTGDTIPNDKFPHGLKWLADEIKELGFHPSLWVNPFMYTTPTAEPPVEKPEIFLKDTSGNLAPREPIRNIMGRNFGDGEYMIKDGVTNIIDVSIPESYEFLEKRYEWVDKLGYDMAMMDFIERGQYFDYNGEMIQNQEVSIFEGIRKALEATREGLGENKNILGCGTIYEPVIGLSNLTRISEDAVAIWSNVKTASNDLIVQYFMNNNLWTNYADGFLVRDKVSPYWREEWWDEEGNLVRMHLSDDEAQFYTAVTGLSQAAVMYTEDIKRLKPERSWLISMVLPIYQRGKFQPVDLFDSTSPKTLQLQCEEGNRKWIVAAGLNWTDTEDGSGLDVNLLNLDRSQSYHAFNIFEQKYTGIISPDTVLGPVNVHGVMLLNLVPAINRPQIVGTNLHISQGGIEIDSENWDENSNTLEIKLNDLFSRKGHLFIHIPDDFSYNGKSGSIIQDNILKLPVVLDNKKSVTLSF